MYVRSSAGRLKKGAFCGRETECVSMLLVAAGMYRVFQAVRFAYFESPDTRRPLMKSGPRMVTQIAEYLL